jgi:hypothetical protein
MYKRSNNFNKINPEELPKNLANQDLISKLKQDTD